MGYSHGIFRNRREEWRLRSNWIFSSGSAAIASRAIFTAHLCQRMSSSGSGSYEDDESRRQVRHSNQGMQRDGNQKQQQNLDASDLLIENALLGSN